MQCAGISDTGRVRENNEDSYCLGELEGAPGLPPRLLLAVADGLGGYSAGEVASGLAIRTLRARLAGGAVRPNERRADGGARAPAGAAAGGASWAERLTAGIAAAHEAIVRQASAFGSLRGMGTTLTAAVVDGSRFHWGHVGDSRAYLVRAAAEGVDAGAAGEGLRLLTRDHSVAADLLASGRIGLEAARRHPDRHVLTQALGVPGDLVVETGEAELGAGDWLILATDGLTSVVRDEEIAEAARASAGAGACCHRLVVLANARGGPDNITVVAARAVGGA